jgi:hypothetical protein
MPNTDFFDRQLNFCKEYKNYMFLFNEPFFNPIFAPFINGIAIFALHTTIRK